MARHEARRSRKHPPAWRFWAILVAGIALIVPLYTREMLRSARPTAPLTSFAGLTDSDGRALDARAFANRYKLVFFGFTHCAAVCPLTLVKVRSILGAVGPRSATLAPVFISIDPDHDSPSMLKAYTEAIDPRIVGMTGDAGLSTNSCRPTALSSSATPTRREQRRSIIPRGSIWWGLTIDY